MYICIYVTVWPPNQASLGLITFVELAECAKKNCRIRYVFHEMFLHIPSGKHLQFAIENGVEIVDDYPVEKWWIFPYKSFSHGFPMVFPSLERPALASVQRTTGLSRPARRRSSPGSQGEKPPELRKKSETPKMEKRNHLPARPEEKKTNPSWKRSSFWGWSQNMWLIKYSSYLFMYLFISIYIYNYIYKIIHIYIYISMYIWYMDVNLTIVNF